MFWLGMCIFIVLAVLPFISAVVLNAKDTAASAGDDQPPSATPEER